MKDRKLIKALLVNDSRLSVIDNSTMLVLRVYLVYNTITPVFNSKNPSDSRFPRRTLITGAHRRQLLLAPNLSSGKFVTARLWPGERVGRASLSWWHPLARSLAPLTVRAARR